MVLILSEEPGAPGPGDIEEKIFALTGGKSRVVMGKVAGVAYALVPDAGDQLQLAAQGIKGIRYIFPAADIPLAESLLKRLARANGVAASQVGSGKSSAKENPPARIAFQGAKGAYSQSAIAQFFPKPEYQLSPLTQFKDVFDAVQNGSCDLGVLPFENALTGSIHENYDLLLQYPDIGIHGETYVRIRHNLIGTPDSSLSTVKKVFSHPQGLLQSAKFLDSHTAWERVSFYDTAGSVEHVKNLGSPENAAIAGAAAAEVYGMKILAEGIETNQHNFTRFCIISKDDSIHLPHHEQIEGLKASIVFSLPHRPGALLHCMQSIGDQDLNLTKIESRPIHGRPWEYMFYLDVEIGGAIDRFHLALHMLHGTAEDLRVLGIYPRA